MKLLKEVYPFILGIIACLLFVFQSAYTRQPFIVGVFVNKFFPCEQNPRDSFPCFGIYDIVAQGIALAICIVLAVIVIYKTVVFSKKTN